MNPVVQTILPNATLCSLAEAIVHNAEVKCSREDIQTISANLEPSNNYQALEWIQKAVESLIQNREPVKVELHPEWLWNRAGSGWTEPRYNPVPPCLLVKIGNALPRMVSLWPKKPFIVLDGYYPENCEFRSVFTPQAYCYSGGKLSEIRLREKCYLNSRNPTERDESWLSIHALHNILGATCDKEVVQDFDRRVQWLEASKAEAGCLLLRTYAVFIDWQFEVNWMKFLKLGPINSTCRHHLCEFDFNARILQRHSFKLEDYMKLLAEAIVKGDQPVIDEEKFSHSQIYRAVDDLYRNVGPEPYIGLPLLNRYLKEIGEYELSIDPEAYISQDWKPSNFLCNAPTLELKCPGGLVKKLEFSPNSPKIFWNYYDILDFDPELYVMNISEYEDGKWSVTLINSCPPVFGREESLQFLHDHGYHVEAENLKFIFSMMEKLFPLKKTNYQEFYEMQRAITKPWRCKFSVPDREVSGFAEYVDLWRIQKLAQAMGIPWIRVDRDFWRNRVFENLAKGEIPAFDELEFISSKIDFAQELYDEVLGGNSSREEQLVRLNAFIRQHQPEAFFTSEEGCKTGHVCSCSDGWHLTLHLPEKKLNLEMRPYDKGFNLKK